jgi:hypothetical protein
MAPEKISQSGSAKSRARTIASISKGLAAW